MCLKKGTIVNYLLYFSYIFLFWQTQNICVEHGEQMLVIKK